MTVSEQQLRQAVAIARAFATSRFIADRTRLPGDILEARFANAFRLNGTEMVAYDRSGNLLFSRANPGVPASFDEALEMLIDDHPGRDTILLGGGRAADAGSVGKSMKRADLEALGPADRIAHIKNGGGVVD